MSAVLRPRPATALYERLRGSWPIAVHCRSDALFAFSVSFIWLALYDTSFWRHTISVMWRRR